MDKKDILCPHCNLTYITQERLENYGNCVSCERRKTLARTKKNQYIKFVDLPEKEKEKILKQREYFSKFHRNTPSKTEEKTDKIKSKTSYYTEHNGIKVRDIGRTIYTAEIINRILEIGNEDLTVTDIFNKLKEEYDDDRMNLRNFYNIINRYNVPHYLPRKQTNTEQSKEIEEVKVIESNEKVVMPEVKEENNFMNNIVKTEDDIPTVKVDVQFPERFEPTRKEVDRVIHKKFKESGCLLPRDYITKEYINMVDMMIYLVENGKKLIETRRSQQNIMNAYQSDTLHEFENTFAEDGNTYLSDKMNIIRNYRRHFENDYKDIATLRPLIESIDVNMLKEVLNKLKINLGYEENAVFKPLVDTTMLDKYDWARPIDKNTSKAKISVTQYNPHAFSNQTTRNGRPVTRVGLSSKTPPTSQLTSKARKSLKIFRVSCRLSGGGYGVFKNWYKDYECANKDIALSYAKSALEKISESKKGVIWSDLDCIELPTLSEGVN